MPTYLYLYIIYIYIYNIYICSYFILFLYVTWAGLDPKATLLHHVAPLCLVVCPHIELLDVLKYLSVTSILQMPPLRGPRVKVVPIEQFERRYESKDQSW